MNITNGKVSVTVKGKTIKAGLLSSPDMKALMAIHTSNSSTNQLLPSHIEKDVQSNLTIENNIFRAKRQMEKERVSRVIRVGSYSSEWNENDTEISPDMKVGNEICPLCHCTSSTLPFSLLFPTCLLLQRCYPILYTSCCGKIN